MGMMDREVEEAALADEQLFPEKGSIEAISEALAEADAANQADEEADADAETDVVDATSGISTYNSRPYQK